MDPQREHQLLLTRRHFLGLNTAGIGTLALASLLGGELHAEGTPAPDARSDRPFPPLAGLPHFPPKAKRVIYLFQSGGPSQMDLFDYKPRLLELRGTDLPDSVRKGQRLTGMTSTQSSFPVVPSLFRFKQYGQSGAWVSELLPYTAKVVDDLCLIKSMNTDAINHDPAITFFQTGAQVAGRPSIGSWLVYGLGSESNDLPGFVVMITQGEAINPSTTGCGAAGFCPPSTRE